MTRIPSIRASLIIPLVLLVLLHPAMPTHGQSDILDSAGSVFDAIARGLNRVGERTQRLFRPRFSPLGEVDVVDFSGKTPILREYTDNFPVRSDVVLSVEHEFGEVRVQAWDNPVVQVRAEILVAADTYDVAQEISRAINIAVDATDQHVDLRTVYPPPPERGRVAKEVKYLVMVPSDASLIIKNSFGDTVVKGVQGSVTLDSQFGALELRDLGGPVRVRARGELPLQAENLQQGGSFELRGMQAEFAGISGTLSVNSFLGSVEVRELGETVDIDVSSDSGPILVHLAAGDDPAIHAHVLFGSLRSDLPLNPTINGDLIAGQRPNPEAHQQIALHASFGDIEVRNAVGRPDSDIGSARRGERTESVVRRELEVPEGATIEVDATIAGDIRIEGIDANAARLRATPSVWMTPQSDPRPAIEAFDVVTQTSDEGVIRIRTIVRDDMTALGCADYRVDLVLSIPRTSPLRVTALDGQTVVKDMGASTILEQREGSVAVEHVKGELTITNHQGDVQVSHCAGPISINAALGTVTTRKIYGPQTVRNHDGKTVIDAPHGALNIRQHGGDVRIIPLEGIHGDFDIQADHGDVSILIPDESNTTLLAIARSGQVRSSIPLTGEIGHGYQRFQGRPRDDLAGDFQVTIETHGGNIVID